jgi:WD40 repeat protein
VKKWDMKSGKNIFQGDFDNEIYSIDLCFDDSLLAVGNGHDLYFYDLRQVSSNLKNTKTLGQLNELHTDFITQINHIPNRPNLIVTAAEDGLLCIHDLLISNEDACTKYTLNIECPIRHFGFFGEDYDGIYVISAVETLSCWHYSSMQRLCHYSTIREDFHQDYLLNCLYHQDHLYLITGSYNGDGKLMKVYPHNEIYDCIELKNGHNDMIRSVFSVPNNFNDQQKQLQSFSNLNFLTTSDDRYMCEWSVQL